METPVRPPVARLDPIRTRGPILPAAPVAGPTRCECRRCGVHVFTYVGYKAAGRCHNCGSYELAPVKP